MYKRQASVFRQMSVEDNIAAVLEMTDKPLDYQKDKLESLIAEFRLQKVRKNKGNQLSLIHILIPPNQHVQKAPMMPANILNVTIRGIVDTIAAILGLSLIHI